MADLKEMAPYVLLSGGLITIITVVLKWIRFKPKDRAEVEALKVEKEIKLSDAWTKFYEASNQKIALLEKQVGILEDRAERGEERLKQERMRCDREIADLWDHLEKLIQLLHAENRNSKSEPKNDNI